MTTSGRVTRAADRATRSGGASATRAGGGSTHELARTGLGTAGLAAVGTGAVVAGAAALRAAKRHAGEDAGVTSNETDPSSQPADGADEPLASAPTD